MPQPPLEIQAGLLRPKAPQTHWQPWGQRLGSMPFTQAMAAANISLLPRGLKCLHQGLSALRLRLLPVTSLLMPPPGFQRLQVR